MARFAGAAVALAVLAGSALTATTASAADPSSDGYSMPAVTDFMGATAYWNRGYTGAGIDVAIIDTGVAPVPGLDAPGKVVHGPDLSFESQIPALARLDTNGHGTFMAGLIAGRDAALTAPYASAPASAYRGMAPDARIVSVKVGVADGGVDVTQMIAAINWVVDHRNDNGMNIRVLNLSYGTNSLQPASEDPLVQAAERAWRAGIVVVAAAGNSGYQRGVQAPGLADPAYSPMLLAVGGLDTKGTPATTDDTVGSYSAAANVRGARAVDVLAVGSRLQGLRVPNSWIDVNHPEGRVGDRFFRGTGTSEAAAITSGAVALLLQQHPHLTPDQVKAMLRGTARPVNRTKSDIQGRGVIDMRMLLNIAPPRAVTQNVVPSRGTGSVERSRGSSHVVTNGVVLTGERDIFGAPFRTGSAADPWVGGTWHGSVWAGGAWADGAWELATWASPTWAGSTWSGSTWSGSTWSGSSWSGSSWSGSSWSGSSWSGSSWSGSSWPEQSADRVVGGDTTSPGTAPSGAAIAVWAGASWG